MELPPTDEHSDENDIIQNRQKQQNVGTCRLAGDAGGEGGGVSMRKVRQCEKRLRSTSQTENSRARGGIGVCTERPNTIVRMYMGTYKN